MAYEKMWRKYRHREHMPVRVRGRCFASVDDCAKHFNLHPKTVQNRLNVGKADTIGLGRGRNPTDARFGANPRSKPVTFFGTYFPSITRAAKVLKVSRPVLIRIVANQATTRDRETLIVAHMHYRSAQCC